MTYLESDRISMDNMMTSLMKIYIGRIKINSLSSNYEIMTQKSSTRGLRGMFICFKTLTLRLLSMKSRIYRHHL